MNRHTAFFYFLLISKAALAQSDNYPGTWQMNYLSNAGRLPVHIELQIANAKEGVLYPAKLQLQCDSFTGIYELLLVKKNSRELAISRNKYPRVEKPFSIGSATFFLNGIFDYSRDLRGMPTLSLNRIQLKPPLISKTDTAQLGRINKQTALQVINFLKDEEIILAKVSNDPLENVYSERITSPSSSPAYFGLRDTVHLKTKDGLLHLSGSKKNDVASVVFNGRLIIDRFELTKKIHTEDILLDTGLNLLVLFAENFADGLPNKGKLGLESGTKKFSLDFNNKDDSAASFIVAKIYCEADKEKETSFKEYDPFEKNQKPLRKNEHLLGSLLSTSQQLTLAVWDDAIEDGDSVSINVNGQWIAKGLPVKIRPRFITVILKPGPNTISFAADNLGSIPPNTSIIEIIDGKKRKSFSLSTVLGEQNLIKVLYEVKAE